MIIFATSRLANNWKRTESVYSPTFTYGRAWVTYLISGIKKSSLLLLFNLDFLIVGSLMSISLSDKADLRSIIVLNMIYNLLMFFTLGKVKILGN